MKKATGVDAAHKRQHQTLKNFKFAWNLVTTGKVVYYTYTIYKNLVSNVLQQKSCQVMSIIKLMCFDTFAMCFY